MSPSINWVKIAESEQEIPFGPNHLAELEADGRKICLGRHNGALFAFAPRCPHASGYFVHGYIDPLGNVVCPLHRFKFCLKNGRNVSGEGYYLKHWPVDLRPDGIYVGLDAKGLFSLF